MSQDHITLAAAQFDPHLFDPGYNLLKMEALMEKAGEHCDLIVFPEAALTGYCFAGEEEVRQGAISQDGPELSRLRELSAQKNLSVAVGGVEKDGEKLYNTVFFLEPDGSLFFYRKSHLPYLGVDRFVEAGEEAAAVFDTRFGKIGIIVCYELRFPETARIAALRGARLLLQPTNLPQGGESHPEFLSRARACENKLYFVSCNRCGTERGFTFLGRSQIVDVNGTVLQEAGAQEELICETLNLSLAENKDIISAPGERELYLLRHRRWDLYAPLSQKPDENGFLSEKHDAPI